MTAPALDSFRSLDQAHSILAGAPVTGPDSLRAALADRGGQTVTLTLVRAGVQQTLAIAVGTRA